MKLKNQENSKQIQNPEFFEVNLLNQKSKKNIEKHFVFRKYEGTFEDFVLHLEKSQGFAFFRINI